MSDSDTLSIDMQILEKKYPEYTKEVEKNYWWNFIVIVLDASFYSFSIAMLSQDTIIPYFVSQLTDQKWIIGLVPALFYFGYFAPQLIGAYIISGKATRKQTIFKIALTERIGILAIALVAQYLGHLTDQVALILFFVSYAIFSITNGMISPGYSDFISKNIIKKRGLFYGTIVGLGGLIGFLASIIATFLLNRYNFPTNLQTLFWIGLGVSVLSPIMIALFRETPYPEERKTLPFGEFLKAIPGHIRAHPAFRRYMIIRAMLSFGIIANAFYALHAIEKFSLEPSVIGIFTMIILLSQSLSGFFWGWLGDRFGYKYNYIIIAVLISVMGILALSATDVLFFYLIAFCIGSIYSAISTSDPNMVFQIAPPAETSLFVGISSTFIAPTMTLAPLIGGFLIDIYSIAFLFKVVFFIGIISSYLTITYMPAPETKLKEDLS